MTDSASPKWNDIKERGGMLPLMLMLWFYRFGGRWLCKLVMYFVIMWYWLFATTARQASLLYLQNCIILLDRSRRLTTNQIGQIAMRISCNLANVF